MQNMIEFVNEMLKKGNVHLWDTPLWQDGWSLMVLYSFFLAAGFTVYLRFVQLTGFKHGVNVLLGRYKDPNDPGDVSHFAALCTALAGTLGLGNIGGVAVGVAIGGPGVTLWMIVIGFLGMASKFAECSLACIFRHQAQDDTVLGGPMYYLEKIKGVGWFLAKLFALVLAISSLGGSNAFQVNQIAEAFEHSFAVPRITTGIIVCICAALVIVGGIKRLAAVSEKVVFFMTIAFTTACVWVIGANIDLLPQTIVRIFHDAFYGTSAVGSFKGAVVGAVVSQALQRALFSCEAGQGSAAIAHAAAKTREGIREGHVALLEPFIDTVISCSITSVMIGITGVWQSGQGGVKMVQIALGPTMGTYFLPFAVLLFGYCTVIAWWYYGSQAVKYLFGESRLALGVFTTVYLSFTLLGSVWSLQSILNLAGIGMALMMLINGVGIIYHAPLLKRETARYRSRYIDKI